MILGVATHNETSIALAAVVDLRRIIADRLLDTREFAGVVRRSPDAVRAVLRRNGTSAFAGLGYEAIRVGARWRFRLVP